MITWIFFPLLTFINMDIQIFFLNRSLFCVKKIVVNERDEIHIIKFLQKKYEHKVF